jgi:hypothetical protein
MKRAWSFYRTADGIFTGRRIESSSAVVGSGADEEKVDEWIQRNTPEGCAAIGGRYDRATQRVVGGQVVPWVSTGNAERHRISAIRAIAVLERAQARVVREALIELLPDGAAKQQLQDLDQKISAERSKISRS